MSKASAQPPKGSRDFLPLDVRRREYVVNIVRRTFETYGFAPLQTPSFERLDALLGKYGQEGDRLLFKLLLRGQPLVDGIRKAGEYLEQPGAIVTGRSGETAPGAETMLSDLGLRYDLTVPLARVYAAYRSRLPAVFRCYQIQPVWRADTPGKGRFREFYQCDSDVVGSASRVCEAEVAAAAAACMKTLGFDTFTLRVNHRGLLRAVIAGAGVPADREADAIVAMDKLDKIGAEGVEEELEARGIASGARERLLSVLCGGADLERIRKTVESSEHGAGAVADIRAVLSLSEVTPAADHLVFDASLARGLDYYTGCIFELQLPDLKSSLGGGGRYDNLIGMFLGRSVPACGFSLGLERILAVMDERQMFPSSLNRIDAVVAAVRDNDLRTALQLCHNLRSLGLRVELSPGPLKPGLLRKSADERGIPAAVWLQPGAGPAASVWRRANGSIQTDIGFDRIAEIIKEAKES